MRLIGHLQNESSAKTLADYLISREIRTLVEPDAEGWAIWVYSEDEIEAGRKALSTYLRNPSDSKFQTASQNAAAVEERKRLEKAKFEKRIHTRDRIWTSSTIGSVTLGLIVASVVVTLLGNLNLPFSVFDLLGISETMGRNLPEVCHGQIWRLITPIFIHFGVLHIVFNMLMLRDLGSLIEIRQSSKTFVLLVVIIGIGSNLGQYYYGGPGFGGMSGVLYGLLGYIWVRSQCDPASGLFLAPMTITVMIVWFFLCLFGVIGSVANACHVVGLLMGMIIGAAPLAKRIV